jgi:hypothetical protein
LDALVRSFAALIPWFSGILHSDWSIFFSTGVFKKCVDDSGNFKSHTS